MIQSLRKKHYLPVSKFSPWSGSFARWTPTQPAPGPISLEAAYSHRHREKRGWQDHLPRPYGWGPECCRPGGRQHSGSQSLENIHPSCFFLLVILYNLLYNI